MKAALVVELIFGLVGGLGIFLIGMKNMSEGMQAVAGSSLRKMIAAVTSNPLLAVGVGTMVTTLIQSSSITTVMVVGFVNSSVMTLQQAIGVIMGANIGTTITGWIIALKVGKYGLPLLGFSAFIYLFSRRERVRNWALFFLGIGMVFLGLEIMKDACKIIRESPDFETWFRQFQADSYFGVLGCALTGCVLTLLVQSSSATLGITITLAMEGLIGYPTAAALVLGENVGTTITAYLASLGANPSARRAAYFHGIFNLVGVFWITLIFNWYIGLIQTYGPAGIDARIAMTHSIFNVVNTIVFLPMVPLFARWLERWVAPGKAPLETQLTELDARMFETPALAIEQSRSEVLRIAVMCQDMLDWLSTLLQQDEPDPELVDKIRQSERELDDVQDEVRQFISGLLTCNIPQATSDESLQQLRSADEYESLSDCIRRILRIDQKLRKGGLRFEPSEREALLKIHRMVNDYVEAVNLGFREHNQKIAEELGASDRALRQQMKELRRSHLEAMSEKQVPPRVTAAFLNTLNAYRQVRDHAKNVADAIAGDPQATSW